MRPVWNISGQEEAKLTKVSNEFNLPSVGMFLFIINENLYSIYLFMWKMMKNNSWYQFDKVYKMNIIFVNIKTDVNFVQSKKQLKSK